jgi:hypothetical protein
MPGFMPGIHVLSASKKKAWMAGTSPAMTIRWPPAEPKQAPGGGAAFAAEQRTELKS